MGMPPRARHKPPPGAVVQQTQAALNLAVVNQRTVPNSQPGRHHQSRAQLSQANFGVRVAEAAQARIRQFKHDKEAAESAERASLAAFHLAETNRQNAVLKAPFDAEVLSKNVEIGDLVSAGSPMITIADMKRPYLRVYVGEAYEAKVKLGQKATIAVDAFPNRSFSGVVDEIRDKAEYIPGNVQTKDERAKLVYGVRLALDNKDGFLKPGLPADASIDVR